MVSEIEVGNESDVEVTYAAKIMIINPRKKKEYVMVKCLPLPERIDFEHIKTFILSSFPEDICKPKLEKLEFGYFEPGHGLKGKKEWILDGDDIKKMMERHGGKKTKEITLWCYSGSEGESRPSRSRSRSPISRAPKARSSRYDAQISKMSRVDEIYKKLCSIHENKFTPEQKTAWAQKWEGRIHTMFRRKSVFIILLLKKRYQAH